MGLSWVLWVVSTHAVYLAISVLVAVDFIHQG